MDKQDYTVNEYVTDNPEMHLHCGQIQFYEVLIPSKWNNELPIHRCQYLGLNTQVSLSIWQ